MQSDKYIAVIDQGTTGTRCIIFNKLGQIVNLSYKKHKRFFLKPGFAEQDPIEIVNNIRLLLKQSLKKAGLTHKDIKSLGITNQRETIVAWDKASGMPIYNAITWQDTRTREFIKKLDKKGLQDTIRKKTGLYLSTYSSASKIKWILDNVPKAKQLLKEGRLMLGTIDTWIIWNLTGGKSFFTDHTNASRTMLFNIKELDWDSELLEIFGLKQLILPEVKTSMSYDGFGKLSEKGLENIPINSDLGDQQSALFGEACFSLGESKITYGTGSFVLQNIGKKLKYNPGLITTCAYSQENKCVYALEGSTSISGAIFDWLKKVRLLKSTTELNNMLKKGTDTDVYFVPAFSGLFSPYWDNSATGTILGISSKTERRDIVLAAVYGICLQIKDIIERLQKVNGTLKVDGGVAANDYIMQLQADILGKKLFRSNIKEATALGAAFSAGLYSDFWKLEEIKEINRRGSYFYPKSINKNILLYWNNAIKRSTNWQNT